MTCPKCGRIADQFEGCSNCAPTQWGDIAHIYAEAGIAIDVPRAKAADVAPRPKAK